MYNKILLTSDGSKNSEHAIRHALQIATDEDAELVVLHVVDSNGDNSSDDLVFLDDDDEVLDHVSGVIEEVNSEEHISSSVRISKLSVEGSNPAEVIVSVCENENIDMIIMANSGKNKLNRFLLGSVTEKTIREAPVPVLVIPANYSN